MNPTFRCLFCIVIPHLACRSLTSEGCKWTNRCQSCMGINQWNPLPQWHLFCKGMDGVANSKRSLHSPLFSVWIPYGMGGFQPIPWTPCGQFFAWQPSHFFIPYPLWSPYGMVHSISTLPSSMASSGLQPECWNSIPTDYKLILPDSKCHSDGFQVHSNRFQVPITFIYQVT